MSASTTVTYLLPDSFYASVQHTYVDNQGEPVPDKSTFLSITKQVASNQLEVRKIATKVELGARDTTAFFDHVEYVPMCDRLRTHKLRCVLRSNNLTGGVVFAAYVLRCLSAASKPYVVKPGANREITWKEMKKAIGDRTFFNGCLVEFVVYNENSVIVSEEMRRLIRGTLGAIQIEETQYGIFDTPRTSDEVNFFVAAAKGIRQAIVATFDASHLIDQADMILRGVLQARDRRNNVEQCVPIIVVNPSAEDLIVVQNRPATVAHHLNKTYAKALKSAVNEQNREQSQRRKISRTSGSARGIVDPDEAIDPVNKSLLEALKQTNEALLLSSSSSSSTPLKSAEEEAIEEQLETLREQVSDQAQAENKFNISDEELVEEKFLKETEEEQDSGTNDRAILDNLPDAKRETLENFARDIQSLLVELEDAYNETGALAQADSIGVFSDDAVAEQEVAAVSALNARSSKSASFVGAARPAQEQQQQLAQGSSTGMRLLYNAIASAKNQTPTDVRKAWRGTPEAFQFVKSSAVKENMTRQAALFRTLAELEKRAAKGENVLAGTTAALRTAQILVNKLVEKTAQIARKPTEAEVEQQYQESLELAQKSQLEAVKSLREDIMKTFGLGIVYKQLLQQNQQYKISGSPRALSLPQKVGYAETLRDQLARLCVLQQQSSQLNAVWDKLFDMITNTYEDICKLLESNNGEEAGAGQLIAIVGEIRQLLKRMDDNVEVYEDLQQDEENQLETDAFVDELAPALPTNERQVSWFSSFASTARRVASRFSTFVTNIGLGSSCLLLCLVKLPFSFIKSFASIDRIINAAIERFFDLIVGGNEGAGIRLGDYLSFMFTFFVFVGTWAVAVSLASLAAPSIVSGVSGIASYVVESLVPALGSAFNFVVSSFPGWIRDLVLGLYNLTVTKGVPLAASLIEAASSSQLGLVGAAAVTGITAEAAAATVSAVRARQAAAAERKQAEEEEELESAKGTLKIVKRKNAGSSRQGHSVEGCIRRRQTPVAPSLVDYFEQEEEESPESPEQQPQLPEQEREKKDADTIPVPDTVLENGDVVINQFVIPNADFTPTPYDRPLEELPQGKAQTASGVDWAKLPRDSLADLFSPLSDFNVRNNNMAKILQNFDRGMTNIEKPVDGLFDRFLGNSDFLSKSKVTQSLAQLSQTPTFVGEEEDLEQAARDTSKEITEQTLQPLIAVAATLGAQAAATASEVVQVAVETADPLAQQADNLGDAALISSELSLRAGSSVSQRIVTTAAASGFNRSVAQPDEQRQRQIEQATDNALGKYSSSVWNIFRRRTAPYVESLSVVNASPNTGKDVIEIAGNYAQFALANSLQIANGQVDLIKSLDAVSEVAQRFGEAEALDETTSIELERAAAEGDGEAQPDSVLAILNKADEQRQSVGPSVGSSRSRFSHRGAAVGFPDLPPNVNICDGNDTVSIAGVYVKVQPCGEEAKYYLLTDAQKKFIEELNRQRRIEVGRIQQILVAADVQRVVQQNAVARAEQAFQKERERSQLEKMPQSVVAKRAEDARIKELARQSVAGGLVSDIASSTALHDMLSESRVASGIYAFFRTKNILQRKGTDPIAETAVKLSDGIASQLSSNKCLDAMFQLFSKLQILIMLLSVLLPLFGDFGTVDVSQFADPEQAAAAKIAKTAAIALAFNVYKTRFTYFRGVLLFLSIGKNWVESIREESRETERNFIAVTLSALWRIVRRIYSWATQTTLVTVTQSFLKKYLTRSAPQTPATARFAALASRTPFPQDASINNFKYQTILPQARSNTAFVNELASIQKQEQAATSDTTVDDAIYDFVARARLTSNPEYEQLKYLFKTDVARLPAEYAADRVKRDLSVLSKVIKTNYLDDLNRFFALAKANIGVPKGTPFIGRATYKPSTMIELLRQNNITDPVKPKTLTAPEVTAAIGQQPAALPTAGGARAAGAERIVREQHLYVGTSAAERNSIRSIVEELLSVNLPESTRKFFVNRPTTTQRLLAPFTLHWSEGIQRYVNENESLACEGYAGGPCPTAQQLLDILTSRNLQPSAIPIVLLMLSAQYPDVKSVTLNRRIVPIVPPSADQVKDSLRSLLSST